ncbi:MAG: FAD-dependent oxidoreductase [Actinomycetota bacterium]
MAFRRLREVGSSRPFDRGQMRTRLSSDVFDVLVIGGGITGLGAAVDAASRGLSTALVERHDFASGTSSKSSKLVHGGLRYLQQGDVRLVYEALHERRRLRRNARYLVEILPFMIPILTRDGLISRRIARALGSALWMYDITGGLLIGRIHRRLRKAKASAHLPSMDSGRLASAYVYYDARADDARLCIALARTASDHGATLLNYAEVVSISRPNLPVGDSHDIDTHIYVTLVRDEFGTFEVRSRTIVNAAGVWVDEVLSKVHATGPVSHESVSASGPASTFGTIRPAKGVHITIPWDKVRNDIAVVIPVPKDRRSLFLVPWGPRADGTFTHTYVGTTDTDYSGSRNDPQCTRNDIDYVVRALNHSLTTGITHNDIVGTWAGLRPLVVPPETSEGTASAGRTADLSRRHRVSVDDQAIVTVTGGKLTTYREMAEDAIDELAPILGVSVRPLSRHRCRTKRLLLHGASRARRRSRFSRVDNHLWGRFGTDSPRIADLISRDESLGRPLVPGLPYLRAEVVFAVREEMALTVDDVLSRRTRALLFDRRGSREAARETALLMAPLLGWDEERVGREVRAFQEICDHESVCAELTEDELQDSVR